MVGKYFLIAALSMCSFAGEVLNVGLGAFIDQCFLAVCSCLLPTRVNILGRSVSASVGNAVGDIYAIVEFLITKGSSRLNDSGVIR